MKIQRFLCSIGLFALLSCFCARLGAQENPTPFQASPVVPSRVFDTIFGKAYRVHTVQKGHTLYSICRAYQTSADSILKDSPDNQVQIDEYVYIPFRLLPGEKAQDFVRFTGKRPWAVVFLQQDEAVQTVPSAVAATPTPAVSENTVAETPATDPETPASPETEEEENAPGKEKAKKRRDRKEELVFEPDTVPVKDTLALLLPDSVFVTPHPQAKPHKDTLQVSLLLPLYSNTPQDKKAYIYLPFFEGATVAWQEHIDPLFFVPPVYDTVFDQDSNLMLQPVLPDPDTNRNKVRIQLKVYDLTQSVNSLEEIVNDPIFQRSDAVIATAFVDQFEILDSLSKAWQMPIIHPISERDSMGVANPYFMQLAASHHTQIDHIADFVRKHHARARLIILSDSTESETRKAEYMQSLLPGSEWHYFNPATVEMLEGLGENNKKTVIIPFYRQEITAVKTVLPLRQTKGNITIIAPNVWLDYASIDLDYYIQNNLTVYHTFCHTAQNTDLLDFSRKYYFLYHVLPNPLAYRGYKTMLWLLQNLNARNADFMRYLDASLLETEDAETDNTPDAAGDASDENAIYILHEREMGGFENKDVHFMRITENGLEPYRQ